MILATPKDQQSIMIFASAMTNTIQITIQRKQDKYNPLLQALEQYG